MFKKITYILSVLAIVTFSDFSFSNEPLSPLQTVDDFYKRLLNYDYHKTPNIPRPEIRLSNSFEAAIDENSKVCKNYATGVCGWGAGADEYLDTQETDPLLNYQNSGIKFREIEKNIIEVKFNVYPSENKDFEFYNRTIVFKMIKEGRYWVVDDVIYGGDRSSRKLMEAENVWYINNPDEDSKMAKKNRLKERRH